MRLKTVEHVFHLIETHPFPEHRHIGYTSAGYTIIFGRDVIFGKEKT